ncbi:hypothetical protein [Paenibacillus vulneris]|uniref:Uncharacterized protein n=1 Tax=Paenibacillus vulneris TaxID=1133364 RepID=A0ABW3UK80_9BACL
MKIIEQINNLVEENFLDIKTIVSEIEMLINKMTISEQLDIHNELSEKAIDLIFKFRNDINLEESVKENIIWWAFTLKIRNNGGCITDELLEDLINVYKVNNFAALEHIAIQAVRFNKISENQLLKVKDVFKSNAFQKEIISFTYRQKINEGLNLDFQDIEYLFEKRVYFLLDYALEHDRITKEGLDYFTSPSEGSSDKKIRAKFFRKAQKLKNK